MNGALAFKLNCYSQTQSSVLVQDGFSTAAASWTGVAEDLGTQTYPPSGVGTQMQSAFGSHAAAWLEAVAFASFG